jgi:hypothetical protein
VNSHFSISIPFCVADLNVLNDESKDFSIGWALPVFDNSSASNPFKYTKALNISSFPLTGVYNTYLGGGYVYQLSTNQTQLVLDLAFLQANNWMDRQTRAVFVEFSLFNPNINMFAYCYMLFEILPTGSMVKSFNFYPMTLFDGRNSWFSFSTVCALIFLVMIFILTLKQIYNIKIHKLKYFKRVWTYLDFSLIAFSFTSFAIWLYRLWEAQSIMSILASHLNSTLTSSSKIVNLQMLAYWDDTLACMLSLCAALGTLKFINLLEFVPSIKKLIRAFEIGFSFTVSYTVVFSLVVFAWVQLGYIVFGNRVRDFSTFIKTLETGFLLILGKFQLNEMIEANAVWAIVFHFTFNFVAVFIFFSLFITILCEALDAANKDEKLAEKLEVGRFIWNCILSFFETFMRKKTDHLECKDPEKINSFIKMHQLVHQLEKMCTDASKDDELKIQ